MTADEIKLTVRMPLRMKVKLKAGADANRRSLNSEILTIIERAMKADPTPSKPATDKAA
ncbi:MAG: Arc family DNA-binding protein [Rhodoblastus sp.]|nr:Arc family DNA-binding protein [Rhodoblastus sp.]MCB9999816.1 Arc family DNA-binding protein [Methylobacteriaceae bacterium]MCC0001518.1 Arc family DNA-binding protein [Methylobacteriaceae bacterium]